MKKILLAIFIAPFVFITTNAQVTIGSDSRPARAAILELKTQNPANPSSANDPANVTSQEGGLMLPRVMLRDTTTLEPFIDPADPDWIDNARTRIKETHAGLTVYNLTANSMFSPGVYSWNGDRWKNTWAYPYGAGNGISIINDSLHIGGSLTKDMTFNTNGHALNFDGTGTLNVNTPVTLADSLIYTYGQPGDGKIMIADANGVGTWQNNNALRTTPAAVLSDTGAIVSPSDGPAFKNTGTYLIIPPGQWFVMITMRADVEGGDGTDRLWVKSTLIREGDTKLDTIYFVGTNRLISGRAYPGKNIISGFLEMKNTTSAPIRFYYSVGDIKVFAGATKPVFIRQIGGKSFRENSIVAFALK